LQQNLNDDLLKYQISAELHNRFLVGYHLNKGLYPISEYDCERILLPELLFTFEEYCLFEYYYISDELSKGNYSDFLVIK
jgi:hypothetical protein